MLSKNYLIYKIHDELLRGSIKSYGRGKLIDIGCGEKLYADMIKPYAREHIGVDHKNMPHDKFKIDLFGTAYDIPVKDEHFDTVLCTAVLEHLEEPDKAIKEANRVLKKMVMPSILCLYFGTSMKNQEIFTDILNTV